MRICASALGLALLGCLAGPAWASNIYGVTHHAGGTQIWIKSASFDSKHAEYQQDVGAVGTLSGSAYYFPTDNGMGTQREKWWGEYSIAAADVPGVTLSGTWWWWARSTQPVEDTVDSDVLYVKNDAEDGSGATWYDDAHDSYTNADDRILNDVGGFGGKEGTWIWHGGGWGEEYRQKDFNLAGDDKIVFRISEREAGPNNARIDAMVWSSIDIYTPTDADYLAVPEPATLALLALGGLGLIRRRRR